MAIDLQKEKERVLTTQDMYEILDFSMQAAEDNGFMNWFIFERALYCFAAIRLYEDRRDEIAGIVAENINTAWDVLIADGTIDEMATNYPLDLELLAEYGNVWFKDFTTYGHSARGLLNTIQTFSGDIVRAAAQQFTNAAQVSGVQQVLDIANDWGMNNTIEQNIEVNVETDSDSLFE